MDTSWAGQKQWEESVIQTFGFMPKKAKRNVPKPFKNYGFDALRGYYNLKTGMNWTDEIHQGIYVK